MTLNELKNVLRARVVDELGTDSNAIDAKVDDQKVRTLLHQYIANERTPLSAEDKKELNDDVLDDILGYGPVQRFLDDPEITEVMINGIDDIYIERHGLIEKTTARFLDEHQLRRLIDRILAFVGRRVDESTPMVDARLPNGSRVNIVIPPLSLSGSTITIRKFSKELLSAEDLKRLGTFTQEVVDFFDACVHGRLNIIISGGTGTGKTTTLNVLSSFIPEGDRIVTIEDVAELQLNQRHVVRLEARPPNIEGAGQVTIRDLVRNSLRMRPDRIVVGEARSGEALDMLQAMYTGHDGSLSTVHANTPRDALSRLETMVLMAGMELPVRAIRDQVASAIDLVIHIARLGDGSRKIVQVAEVQGMEGEIITMQDIFVFDFSAGVDEDGRYLGRLKATGVRPGFVDKLARHGVILPIEIFTYAPPERGAL